MHIYGLVARLAVERDAMLLIAWPAVASIHVSHKMANFLVICIEAALPNAARSPE